MDEKELKQKLIETFENNPDIEFYSVYVKLKKMKVYLLQVV